MSERAYGFLPTQKRRPDSPGTAFIQSVRPICAKGTACAKGPADD
jgi:hypothetical protein